MVSITVICLTPLCEQGRLLHGASGEEDFFAGREITCAIDLGDDMLGSHGLETGFSYELLNRFAEDNGCSLKIITRGRQKDISYRDSLEQGKIDILITHVENEDDFNGLNISHTINGCTSWLTSGRDLRSIKQINNWFGYFTATDQYSQMKNRSHSPPIL